MKLFGALLFAVGVAWQVVPHEVTHNRCLKVVSQDEFDRAQWVTRDGRRSDVIEETCHRMRFTRWLGVEWIIPDSDWVLPVTVGSSEDDS